MGNSDYIDLVMVQTITCGKVLCRAPGFSNLKEGDVVQCEIYDDGKVIAIITVGKQSDVYDFFCKATEAKEPPPKIKSKVVYEGFSYDEQEDANG